MKKFVFFLFLFLSFNKPCEAQLPIDTCISIRNTAITFSRSLHFNGVVLIGNDSRPDIYGKSAIVNFVEYHFCTDEDFSFLSISVPPKEEIEYYVIINLDDKNCVTMMSIRKNNILIPLTSEETKFLCYLLDSVWQKWK